ncbi:MAG: hypothetical protein M3Y22_18285, partial [Pseudomonadota bacterium]|nr:hypothetical protein [Pseudomonadota bacterium]
MGARCGNTARRDLCGGHPVTCVPTAILHGYCASPDDGSAIRTRVIAAFDHFTSISALSDEAAARHIRADEIDILIDLNGLTSGSRLQILRWRPAPVQATYLGFIGPVPLPELDHT